MYPERRVGVQWPNALDLEALESAIGVGWVKGCCDLSSFSSFIAERRTVATEGMPAP